MAVESISSHIWSTDGQEEYQQLYGGAESAEYTDTVLDIADVKLAASAEASTA